MDFENNKKNDYINDTIKDQEEIENNLEYEKDEDLDEYLYINERVNTIYSYIKNISKNSLYPLFDTLTKYSLLEFLYSDLELDDKYLF